MADTDALRVSLDDAHAVLRSGDANEAERRAKAVSAIIRAERELAELPSNGEQEQEDDVDARAELIDWITGLVAAHRAGAPLEELERLASGDGAARLDLPSEPAAATASG